MSSASTSTLSPTNGRAGRRHSARHWRERASALGDRDGIDLLAVRAGGEVSPQPRSLQDAAMALAEGVRCDYASLRSRLAVLEAAQAEVLEAFGGDEVATAEQRELLDAARAMLGELASDIEPLIGVLPGPREDEAFEGQLRRAVELERDR